MNNLKSLIDRPNTTNIKNLDRMLMELSPHLTEFEIDRVVEFMNTISDSKFDINPTVDESASQIKLILGAERYEIVKSKWALKNQHLLKNVETKTKYIHRETNMLYDGLDPDDRPEDYIEVEM